MIVADKIVERHTMPLRILGNRGSKYFACPYELTSDNLEVTALEVDQRIAQFTLTSTDQNPGFKRVFLYTRTRDQDIITTSGYLLEGPVSASYQGGPLTEERLRNLRRTSSEAEIEEMVRKEKLLGKIDAYHVKGDKKNKTAGLDEAIERHRKRIELLSPEELTIQEALEFYNFLRHNIPRT